MTTKSKPPDMSRIVCGIRPTGNVHLGNYLGAILPAVKLQGQEQNQYAGGCYFFIADLHALTESPNPEQLKRDTLSTAALYLACGLDPARVHLFVQSQVESHAQLARLLGSLATVGVLKRMVQYKEKSQKSGSGDEAASLSLFDYPVLMAADILANNCDFVPVGEDQRQHLELTRDLAQRFNHIYGKGEAIFKLPRPHVMAQAARIKSLVDGSKKMSKTDSNDAGRINLLDTPEVIASKIKKAKTDAKLGLCFDDSERPEVHNLLTLYQIASGKTRAVVAMECADMGFGLFKKQLAEAVITMLAPIQERYKNIMADPEQLQAILRSGAQQARLTSNQTLDRVKSAMGFLIF